MVNRTKEGVIEAITKVVGSNVTNTILQTANGSNHKSINEFMLFRVMKVAINRADRPSTDDVLEQFLEVINHTFDFQKKVSVNMELIQSNATQMAAYGIVIGIPQLRLILLANIKTATKSNYGRKFHSAMNVICKKIHIQSHARCDIAPNYFDGARRSQWGKGPKRCTCTKNRDRTFSHQFRIILPLNDE